jgi:hypothetical protein
MLLAACACGGSSSDDPTSTPAPPTCALAEIASPDGKCVPLGDCAPGSMPVLGEGCHAIGWSDCSAGFTADPSGWGCHEIAPAAACTGATRESLGSGSCVPVGDCSAPFPPSNARLFVSTSGPLDATHFHTLDDAGRAAKAGDVIAIDDGTYSAPTEIDSAVTIVGRCPEKTILDGGHATQYAGILAAAPVTLRGVTIEGFEIGFQAAADATLEDVVLDDNDDANMDFQQGTKKVALRRSVVRGSKPKLYPTAFGIDMEIGAIEVEDSAIIGNQGGGMIVPPGASAAITSSIIASNIAQKDGTGGYGLNVQGGSATVKSSFIATNADTGARVLKGGKLTIDHTVVRGTRPGSLHRGYGVVATEDGTALTMTSTLVTENIGLGVVIASGAKADVSSTVIRAQVPIADPDFGDGIYVFDGSSLTMKETAILENTREGVTAFDKKTNVSLDHVLVAKTQMLADGGGGGGMIVAIQAHASVTSCAFLDNHHTGLYVDASGTLDVTGTTIRGTQLEAKGAPLGHGILAIASDRVTVTGCEIRNSAGVGLAFANVGAVIASSVIADNTVGIHAQEGSRLIETDTAPDAPSGHDVTVTNDTRFENNATRIGSGEIALPAPIVPTLDKP